MVEPDVVDDAGGAVVALARAVVDEILHVERRRAELALVRHEVVVAVEAVADRDVVGVEFAVAVAVLALVGDAAAVEVLAQARGEIARVGHSVSVAVAVDEVADVGDPVAVAVLVEGLALVGHAVAVAVAACARGDVRGVEHAVHVAVLALVGAARAVEVEAGAVGEVAGVRSQVAVAVAGGRGRSGADLPLAREERLFDRLEGGRAAGEVVGIDRRLAADKPAAPDHGVAARVEGAREVVARHRAPRADEERRAVGADVDVLDVEGPQHAAGRGVHAARDEQLRVVGHAVAVGIAPDADVRGLVLGQEDEHHLDRLDDARAVLDAVLAEPGHVRPDRADAELRAAVVEAVLERIAELALVEDEVAIAVGAEAGGEVARVDHAVAVAVLARELALVGESVAVAVDRGIRGDLAGVDHAVAVAIGLASREHLAHVAEAVAVAVGVARVGRAVEVAVGGEPVGDVAGVRHAVVVAVEAARVVEQTLGRQHAAHEAQLVEIAVEVLVERTARVGVGADHDRTARTRAVSRLDLDVFEEAVETETHDRARRIEGDREEVPGAVDEREVRDRRPGRSVAVAEAEDDFAAGEVLGAAVGPVGRVRDVAATRVDRVFELRIARIERLALQEHLPRGHRRRGTKRWIEANPCLDGEALVAEGEPAVGILDEDARRAAEASGESVDRLGLRDDRHRDLELRGRADRARSEGVRTAVEGAGGLLEAPVRLRARRRDVALVGDAVAVAVGTAVNDALRIDDAVLIAVARGVRPAVAVEIDQRTQRLGRHHEAFAAGWAPLETRDGAAARLEVFHHDRDRHVRFERDRARPGGRALRLPAVDQEDAVDPETHAVVGGRPEGVGARDRWFDQAGPAHREVAVGQFGGAVEVEVDLGVDSGQEPLGEVPGPVERGPVLADQSVRDRRLAGIEQPVAIGVEAGLALVGQSVAVAVEAGAAGDVLGVLDAVSVAIIGAARPAKSVCSNRPACEQAI